MNEPFILFSVSVSLWSRSEKKSKEQFKQIVLSTEFEFYWAKLSWKLTALGETGAEGKLSEFIYCISQIARMNFFKWILSSHSQAAEDGAGRLLR